MVAKNIIAVLSPDGRNLLLCRREKEPYKGLLNFVGGKVEPGETGIDAAYRELEEETAITSSDITLSHLMDFCYYDLNLQLAVYGGRLRREVAVHGSENPLCWAPVDDDYFDSTRYAGMGNLGHVVACYLPNLLQE